MLDNSYIEILKSRLDEIGDIEIRSLINKLIDERQYLMNVARIDPLTGVYNKNVLGSIRKCDFAVMCDVDNFKTINDTYGHVVGDSVIKKVAEIMSRNFRLTDQICRFGGDEFFIAIANCDKEVVYDRLNKIKSELLQEINLPNFSVTLSIGVAQNFDNESIDVLLEKADIALYKSKNNGKNMISDYNGETLDEVRRK